MTDKEERIWIECELPLKKGMTDSRRLLTMTRPEAINKIETRLKVFLDNLQKNKDKVMPWYTTRDIAEVALKALLGGGKR